jgi:uncharacterized protein (TIGR03435 family)
VKLFFAALISVLALAPPGAPPAEFEVATVKVLPPVPLGASLAINLGTYRNGSLTMNNVSLSECLQFAYGLVSEDQVSGPDWIKSHDTRYQIAARTAPDVELEQARVMVQALLAERLKVVLRKEARPVSFAALVPARGGVKLVPADQARTGPPETNYLPGRIIGSSVPMPVLAILLSRFERQLILDRTGLTGRYHVRLEWASEIRLNGGTAETPGPSLSDALNQLGLRLEPRKEPLDSVVVERAEKMPTDN